MAKAEERGALLARLDELRERIISGGMGGKGSYDEPYEGYEKDLWGGAGVIICYDKPEVVDTYYGKDTYVETAFATELSWLFMELRDIFQEYYDYSSKYEFFGRLADAANAYLDAGSGLECDVDLLLAALEEACLMASQIAG